MSAETENRIIYPVGFVSQIQLNDDTEIDVNQNEIIVFVGTNNSGKSQALKDIYSLSESKQKTIIVKDVKIKKEQFPSEGFFTENAHSTIRGTQTIMRMFNENFAIDASVQDNFKHSPYYGNYRVLFVSNLTTDARLTICSPAPNISSDEPKVHPIHYAAFNAKYRKWLSDNFQKAFGDSIIPNAQVGSKIPLCMGAPVELSGEYIDEQERLEKYRDVLSDYPHIHQQGDGIRSFTGILLHLMMSFYCTYLIDEPESFLHPPQAKIIGRIIGETLTQKQQAFISTHNEELIRGLLESAADRVKLIRITREGTKNSFSILNNRQITSVWSDPLLKHSNILSSLFYKTVVVCESDSDCKFYSIVEDNIRQNEGKFSETHFIHCGGKQRVPVVVNALRALGVSIRVILDIDILSDENEFERVAVSMGIDYNSIKQSYSILAANLHSSKEKILRDDTKKEIEEILGKSKEAQLSEAEIKELTDILKVSSKWKAIKEGGAANIPSGDATVAFEKMNFILKENYFYLVPVGELEKFVKKVGCHGPKWVNTVLEEYPDLNADEYTEVKQFISSMNL